MTRDRLLVAVALLSVAAFAILYVVALHTPSGLSTDRSAFERMTGNAPLPFATAGQRTLRTIDVSSVSLALLVFASLAFLRGRFARAAVAAAVVVASVLAAELLKHGLPDVAGRPRTFPSGHTAIAVSLGLALVIAVPQMLRPTAALLGAAYGAAIAFSVVLLGWHYPSDAIGSFFVCAFFAAVGGLVLRASPRRPSVTPAGVGVAVLAVALGLAVAAALAARHPGAVDAARSRPLVVAAAAAYGALSVLVFALLTPLLAERADA